MAMHPNKSEGPDRAGFRGSARDKVAFPDPAAAPLGTDDEAAGTPPGPRLATDREIRRDRIHAPAASDERGRTISGEAPGLASARIGGTLAVTLGIALVGLLVLWILA